MNEQMPEIVFDRHMKLHPATFAAGAPMLAASAHSEGVTQEALAHAATLSIGGDRPTSRMNRVFFTL
jgi:hypothetical protein